MLVDGTGCWSWVRTAEPRAHGRPALFLDRDGVLVEEVGFLRARADVALVDGAAEIVAACNDADIPVVVVTNQSGIARGILTWDDFDEVHREIELQLLSASRARLDAVYACGYHAEGRGALRVADHPWCKPNPGMILAAVHSLHINARFSWVVGDRARDLMAGVSARLAGGVQVMTGHATENERDTSISLKTSTFDVIVAESIREVDRLVDVMAGRSAC